MLAHSASRRRAVLVTGAGKGLGRAFAIACAARGDAVLVNNRQRPGASDSAAETVAAIQASGGVAAAERSDVTDPGAPEAIAAAAQNAFGGLDAAILNAGIDGPAARFDDLAASDFDAVLETNFHAQIRLVRALLPMVEASPQGRLVVVASVAGLHGLKGRSAYAASKAALTAFARSLAAEHAKAPLRVNVIAPYAATRMTADALSGETAEVFSADSVAPFAAWLASEDCPRTGDVWVCGAGAARPAAMMEAQGGPLPLSFDGSEAIDALAPFDAPRTFKHAGEAFADFAAHFGSNR